MKRIFTFLFLFFVLQCFVSADEDAYITVVIQDDNIENIHLFQKDNNRYIRSIHVNNENYTYINLYENISYVIVVEPKIKNDFIDLVIDNDNPILNFQKTYIILYIIFFVILVVLIGINIYIFKKIIK